jgi:hypothetical protein
MEKLDILRNLVFASELIAFLTGLFYFKKVNELWQIFCLYLGFTFIIEIISWYFILEKNTQVSVIIHRYFANPFQFMSLFWIFGKIVSKTKSRYIFLFGSMIFIVSWLFEYYFLQKSTFYWMSISYTVANIILIVLVLSYFYQLITSEKILIFYKLQSFWFCLGVLIYYFATFPFFGMFNYLVEHYRNVHFIYFHIVLILDIIMYLLFAASFIWGKEK